MDFEHGKFNQCPVPNCTGGGKDKFGIYRHFCLLHPKDSIVINEDGELPTCNKYGMRTNNMAKHLESYTCKKGTTRRQNKVKQDNQAEAENITFNINGTEIEKVHNFKIPWTNYH